MLLILKSVQTGHFKHSGKYYLLNGRWHKLQHDTPAPKGASVSAHPHAAGKHEPVKHFTPEEWDQLKLPAENVNAGSYNKHLDRLKGMSESGDVTGILGSQFGTNTYGKRASIVANHLLALHGSQHTVRSGQKAGEHEAVQVAPTEQGHAEGDKWVMPLDAAIKEHRDLVDIAETPDKEDDKAELGEQKAELAQMEAAKAEPEAPAAPALTMPAFQEGKTVTGVVDYYSKVAQKVLDMSAAGDVAGLAQMKADGMKPNSKGKVSNTWAGKTANSKVLLDLHSRAMGETSGQEVTAQPAKTTEQPAAVPAPAPVAQVDKSQRQVEKLRAVADALKARAAEALGRDRNTNTAKRANQAGSAISTALDDQSTAQTINNLADAIESGEAKHLSGISSKAQVDTLQGILTSAIYQSDRGLTYSKQLERKGREPEPQDIRNARMPQFILYSDMANKLAGVLDKVRGGSRLANRLRTSLRGGDNEKINLSVDDVRDIVAKVKDKKDVPWQFDEALKKTDRLNRMGITTDTQLQLALTEFVMFRAGKKAEDPIAKIERSLVGQKLGIDFFPTPKALASRMAEKAGIKPGMKVLEPSAGSGNLADAARAAGATVDAVEMSSQLRSLLQAKGHNVVAHDFEDFKPEGKYDAVIMNPPFSDRKDALHIQSAYDMLKPGGSLVAISGEGVFFGSDKKAEAFRSWLEEHGAEIEKLPAGTFEDKSLLATTSANARLITLHKPAATKQAEGPQEGERNSDGLIFRDGRWHRDESEAAAVKPQPRLVIIKPAATAIDEKAHEAATSAQNDTAEPTPAQIEAGNYKKGHISVHGIDIAVENPKGSTRSGESADGKKWSHEMSDHYGYIKGTTGADGDQVDVYVGGNPESGTVFVIDQVDANGAFDEHKVMMGFDSEAQATAAYRSNFDAGWKVGPVTAMSVGQFKQWLKGDTSKPLAGQDTAGVNDRDNLTFERTTAGKKPESVTFSRGEKVKLAGTFPMKTGNIDGISQANKKISVNGVWHDYGYVYKQDYDEFAAPKAELDKQIKHLSDRLDENNGIEGEQMLEGIRRQADKFGLAEYKNKIDVLSAKLNKVNVASKRKLDADKADRAARDEAERSKPKAATAADEPIKMTMEQWKKVHADFKGRLPDGTRAVVRDGGLRSVEIVKPEAVAAAAAGPKEGDRDADGLIFRDGRWHRDEAAQSAPVLDDGLSDDPNSPNYRFADTGEIAGSRKEMAAQRIKGAAKSGLLVRATDIDWQEIEKNPREARELIKKSNLFGKVDWDGLRESGTEPGAAFLMDRIYASVAVEPDKDSPQKRKDYALGIETLRDRMERCKTANEVTEVLQDIVAEFNGEILSARESEEYKAIQENVNRLSAVASEAKAVLDTYYQATVQPQRDLSVAVFEQGKRERRGWKPDADLDAKVSELKAEHEKAMEAYTAYRDAHPELISQKREIGTFTNYDSDLEYAVRIERQKANRILSEARAKNLENNPLTRGWTSLGSRFIGVLQYRRSKGSDAFAGHVYNAKNGKIKDWSWAEKDSVSVKKATKAEVSFQLKVAENFTRKGGKEVSVSSTLQFKDMFNLRDVQSGNWVLNDPSSAAFHVQHATEAFSDLAGIIGVPEADVSMNGRLAMAFGARGSGNAGWKGAARAHYEPVQRVINLTKMGGGGTLGHEWFHALDNMMLEAEGGESGKDSFASHTPEKLPVGELREAMTELVNAMTKGNYRTKIAVEYTPADIRLADANLSGNFGVGSIQQVILSAKNAEEAIIAVNTWHETRMNGRTMSKGSMKRWDAWKRIAAAHFDANPEGAKLFPRAGALSSSFAAEAQILDGGVPGKYWSETHEMAARAFQSYIEDKLADNGQTNDYLSVYADNKHYVDPIFGPSYPYPEGDERKAMNKAFDKLMAVLAKRGTLAKAALLFA